VTTVTITQLPSSNLRGLIVAPEASDDTTTVLLFLHGMKEAGASPNELPKVCVHQSPPWQAIAGRIPDTIVVAPQAPAVPDEQTWNWRDHVTTLSAWIRGNFSGGRVLATGFSRGGLGVLQLLAIDPELIERWSVIDPQPPRDQHENETILAAVARKPGWVRYGAYRSRSPGWTRFADALAAIVPDRDHDTTTHDHGEMALRAYAGDRLSSADKPTLYEFLGLRFSKRG
jgi:pimeloyl-ACP methyl ester carboxylesterase